MIDFSIPVQRPAHDYERAMFVWRATLASECARDSKKPVAVMNTFQEHDQAPAKAASGEMIARSESIRNILEQLKTVALSDSTVLLIGETGFGKELFAEYVHKKSVRRFKPLIKVVCSNISRTEKYQDSVFKKTRFSFFHT